MAVPIIKITLSKNPANTNDAILISVTIVTHRYLQDYTHVQLSAKTHAQLAEGGME